MTVMAAHEPLPTMNDDLLDVFLNLDTPPGYKAELIEGEIVVTPPPSNRHDKNITRFVAQVFEKSSTKWDHSGTRGLELPRLGAQPHNHFIPDALFAPRELDVFEADGSYIGPDGVAMVAEVTSSNADRDREEKRRCYAQGGIPLYLLIDRERATVVLFSDPVKGDYKGVTMLPFGKPLHLPEPFGFELDTSDFV
jgi:Uma2 family endonuclease